MGRSIKPLFSLFSLLCFMLSAASFSQENIKSLAPVDATGTARSMAGDELYKEFHRMGQDYHSVDYQRPDGSWLAHKQINYDSEAGITSFKLHYPTTDRRENVVAEAGKVLVDIYANGKKTEHRMIYRPGDAIDAGFDTLMRANWEKLKSKKTFKARFLLFRRGSWVNMTLSSVATSECLEQFKSDITQCVSVRPESLFLRIIVPRLLLGYNDKQQLKLYVGPSNLKLDKRKPSSLVITYQYSDVNDS